LFPIRCSLSDCALFVGFKSQVLWDLYVVFGFFVFREDLSDEIVSLFVKPVLGFDIKHHWDQCCQETEGGVVSDQRNVD